MLASFGIRAHRVIRCARRHAPQWRLPAPAQYGGSAARCDRRGRPARRPRADRRRGPRRSARRRRSAAPCRDRARWHPAATPATPRRSAPHRRRGSPRPARAAGRHPRGDGEAARSRRPARRRPGSRRRRSVRRGPGRARSTPSRCRAGPASRPSAAAHSGANTPVSCRRTRAGLASGPSRLKIVRVPSSTRGPAAWRIEGWWRGANRKAQFAARRISGSRSSGTSTFTPSAASTSAPPVREDSARLPCLATGTPQPATTKVTAVETFSVPAASPPVPQTSIASGGAATAVIRARMARTAPVISGTVSPRTRIAISRRADLRRRRLAGHDDVERGFGVAVGQRLAGGEAGEERLQVVGHVGAVRRRAPGALLPRAIARKLASNSWPCSLAMLSGWNCTPKTGSVRWRMPMTRPSSVQAVGTSTSGKRRRGRRSGCGSAWRVNGDRQALEDVGAGVVRCG